MLRNYLTTALRNLLRHRRYALINVLGLAIGLACCILVVLFVQREFSFNRFHENSHRLYRVIRGSKTHAWGARPTVSGALAPALKAEFPAIEDFVRLWSTDVWVLGNERVFEQTVAAADSNFFEIFSFPLVDGDPRTVLREPGAIVISESMAKKYFGDADPVGRRLDIEDLYFGSALTVSGVMADPGPDTSWDLTYDAVTATLGQPLARDTWERWSPYRMFRPVVAWILLRRDADLSALQAELPAFLERHLGEELAKTETYRLQSLDRMYIYGTRDDGESWAMTRIKTYAVIAAAILLIACINFMNLATARSMLRSREVGMRKAIGARRIQLVSQFLAESLLLALFGFAAGFAIACLALPVFEQLIGEQLALRSDLVVRALPWLLLITTLTGLVAGSYPAFVLSRSHPVDTLRGDEPRGSAGMLRRGLVVLQFTVAIFLLIGTLVIQSQIDYVTNRPLGIDRDNVVIIPLYEMDRQSKADASRRIAWRNADIRQSFLAHPDVLKVSTGRSTPGSHPGHPRKLRMPEKPDETFEIFVQEGDENFIDFFGLNLLAGRNFRPILSDTLSYILNQSAVNRLGLQNPIGAQVEWITTGRMFTVIGVIEDFQNRSLRQTVAPAGLMAFPPLYYDLYIKYRPGRLQEVLPFLEETWQQFLPNRPFRYRTMEDDLFRHYWGEWQFRRITRAFCGLAMLLACLGLYGLAAFTAERRTREIGIRKVLGASTGGLTGLVAREFALLVGVANVVAWPLAYAYFSDWLGDFVQRTDLTPAPFLISTLSVLAVAMLTVAFRTYAAATSNPVDALRVD